MAHSVSAIKRVRQNEKHRLRNRGNRTRLRSQIKKLRGAIDANNAEEATKLLSPTVALIDTMVKKGVIHENAGARYKSRLARQLSAIAS